MNICVFLKVFNKWNVMPERGAVPVMTVAILVILDSSDIRLLSQHTHLALRTKREPRWPPGEQGPDRSFVVAGIA